MVDAALGIIEAIQEQGKVDLAKTEHNSALWLHTLISAIRLAFADTRAYVADPEHARVPVKELLSKVIFVDVSYLFRAILTDSPGSRIRQEYLRKRAELFDPAKSTPIINKGTPLASSDTVLFTAADQY